MSIREPAIESVASAVVAQGLHRPVAFLGTLVAIQGGGAIVGGLSAGPAIRRVREGIVVAGCSAYLLTRPQQRAASRAMTSQ